MGSIAAATLPSPSLVQHALVPCHYADAFALQVPPGTFGDVDALARAATQMPSWVSALMTLRNRLVRPFGLKTEAPSQTKTLAGPIAAGDTVGIFLVLERTDEELLMGLDDKHLDFRFSLLLQQRADGERAIASTTVRFKNVWGRVYFAFVKPVHKLIVPAMLRAAGASRAGRVEVLAAKPR